MAIAPELLGYDEFAHGNYWPAGEGRKLFVDEAKQCYGGLGMKRFGWLKGMKAIFSSKSRQLADEAKKEGVSGNLKGDGFQLGAMYIIQPVAASSSAASASASSSAASAVSAADYNVWFEYKQQEYADLPSNAELLSVLTAHVTAIGEDSKVQNAVKQQKQEKTMVCDAEQCSVSAGGKAK